MLITLVLIINMSHSSDDETLQTFPSPLQSSANKKRRIQSQRACDRCRQKKIRCDGTPSRSKCSHCLSSGSDCIFTESTKARGPPKRYVDSLETRLEKMEGMLSRLYPDGDFSQEMELDGWARSFQPESTEDRSLSQQNTSSSKGSSPLRSSLPVSKTPGSDSDDSTCDSDADPTLLQDLHDHIKRLSLRPTPRRYFGESSGISLLRTAMTAKSKASSGESPAVHPEKRSVHRDEFWRLHPWENDRVQYTKRHYDFPEPDLLTNLIAIYFKILAPMIPLLHRPTFMSAFDDGLHLRNDKFGALVLLVCATASRYSQDPRTLLEGGHLHSAGWKWFRQVEPFSITVLAAPELYDLQIAALAVMFVQGTLPPHEAWIMVGVGLRLAQDVGAHRRQLHHGPPTVEDELWKRAFWYASPLQLAYAFRLELHCYRVLLMYDIWSSSYLGRPCAISEENYDVELPIECDDEYWENPDPTLAFKQRPGKPSHVAYFNHLIKINILHSHALRTIYSINKSRSTKGPREKGWQEHTVASLDSALNSWFDSIPDHLRWDPQRENQTFFVQSASLRIAFYFIQITIHRPFIPSFHKESSLSFPALAICASAARACSHVADALRKRYPILSAPNIQFPTFVSGVILLLSLWGAKRSGTSPDPARDIQDVRNCVKLLELAESRWSVAGRLRDLITDLSAAGDLTIPAASPPSNKRELQQPQRLMSLASTPYQPVSTAQDDSSSRHTSIHLGAEFVSHPVATPVSALVPSGVLQSESTPGTFGPSVHSVPSNNVAPMLLPRPYSGSYRPLGGSSGLGRAVPAIELPTSAPAPATATFGSTASLSGTAAFAAPPTMHGNGQRTLTLTSGPGGALSPGMGMVLKNSGMYDLTASATTPVSASASSSSGSPQTGFRPSADFGAGDATEVFDTTGMEMEFGGYGVPPADKEAMLRHFAPVLLQDGQIGVDRDTVMMWSTMPSTYETQDWETYMSSIMGMANTNTIDPGVGINVGGL
ncbi:hypothetical protein BJV78DRAFT_1363240 [Lactifluus subvellereus]|nr:hypothetical protein BJV78DRAFT_1363240 [Lactifluus subvellereus]